MANEWNWKALAATLAVFWGLYMFVAGIFAAYNITTLWFSPEAFKLLASIYPGFSAGIGGAFIGLLWGIADGALCGAVTAFVYNWFNQKFS